MTFATAFVLLLSLQAPQQAPPTAAANGLKATIRLNIAKVDVPANAPVSPLGNMGALIAQLLTPDGPVEIDYLIAGDADARRGSRTAGGVSARHDRPAAPARRHDQGAEPGQQDVVRAARHGQPRRADRRAGRANGTDRGDRDDCRPARGALSLRRNPAIPGTGRSEPAVRFSDEHRSVRATSGRRTRSPGAATPRSFRRSRRRPPFPAWRR